MAESKPKRESKFRPDEVKAYLDAKAWTYEKVGTDYKVQVCVFCGNAKKNLEVNVDRGFYKTWCCGERGSFYELRKHLGDEKLLARSTAEDNPKPKRERLTEMEAVARVAAKRVWERPAVLDYLHERGFDDKTIKHFRLGAQKRQGVFWLTIPHLVDGEAVNIKYRTVPPAEKNWRQEEGSQKVLFNSAAIEEFDEIILAEGELKACALWQMGFQNVISLTGGVENFQPAWVDQLMKMKKIFIVMDSDAAGQRGAEKLSMRLGPERCFNIVLPDGKDPDEFFFEKGHSAKEFQKLLDASKKFDLDNVVTANRAMALLREELLLEDAETARGLVTPWDEVNKLMGGMRPGDLIVVAAQPKIGKTTWCLNIANYQAQIGNPVFFYCLEMSAKRIMRKLTSLRLDIDEDTISVDDVSEARFQLRSRPLIFLERVRRNIKAEEVFESLKLAYQRYGLKLIIFDNIHFLVRSSDNLREKIGEVSQGFKLLAEELQIPIMLIAHPKKISGKNKIATAEDLKESGALHADADQVIILHRDRLGISGDDDGDPDNEAEPILSPETKIIVDASRYTEGGWTKIHYEGSRSKFSSLKQRREF